MTFSDDGPRYVHITFPCKRCQAVNNVRIDLLKDLYHKARNPPLQAGNQQPFYYGRNCVKCNTYNEFLWQEDAEH